MSKLIRTLIMGPPGSGKGTISDRIVKDFGLKHLSSGDLLRSQMAHGTAAGVAAKKFIEEGKLVPDDVMCDLILGELDSMKAHSWLLDGFPRTVTQADRLLQQQPLDSVLNLDVPFDVIVGRIQGRWVHAHSGRVYNLEWNPPKSPGLDDVTGEPLTQRDDDKEETVRARLDSYRRETQPLCDYFREHGVLANFTGSYSNEIWPHVHKHLATLLPALQCTEYK